MSISRTIVLPAGLIALLGGASWLMQQLSAEVKSPAPIASTAASSKAKKSETGSTPKVKKEATKPTPASEASEPSADAFTPGRQEYVQSIPPPAPSPRQDPLLSMRLTSELHAAMEQTLHELGAEGNDKIHIVSSTCETATCRLALDAEDAGAMDQFLTRLPFVLGWNATAQMEHVTNPDGSLSTTVYLENNDVNTMEN